MDRKKVLIVEDEPITAMEMKSTLRKIGYEVVSVVDRGSRAIKIVEDESPEIVLMDVNLKGEKDGIETAKQIRKITEIPIVYVTAYSNEDTLERASHTNPEGYLVKPVTDDDLASTLKMALSRGTG